MAEQRTWLSTAVRAAVGVVLVALILRQLDLQQLERVMVSPQWGPLGGMAVAGFAFMLLGGVKAWIVLSALAPVRLATVMRYYLVAGALGSFTPAAVGDFSLAGFLRREHVPLHQGLSAMLVDRAITLGLYALVYLPLALMLILGTPEWLWVPAALGVGAAIGVALNRRAGFRHAMTGWIIRPWVPSLEDFFRSCSDLLRFHPRALLTDLAVTVFRSLVSGIVIYLALWAAGADVGYAATTVLTNSLSLLTYLPISISGIGIYEGGAVAVFSRLGADSERVFAAFVFQRIYIIASSLLMLGAGRLLLRRSTVRERAAVPSE